MGASPNLHCLRRPLKPCAHSDVYLLLTPQSGLLPAPWRIMAAAAYDPSPTVKLDHEATIEDGTDFFFDCASPSSAFLRTVRSSSSRPLAVVTRDRTGLVATRCVSHCLSEVLPPG